MRWGPQEDANRHEIKTGDKALGIVTIQRAGFSGRGGGRVKGRGVFRGAECVIALMLDLPAF